MSEFSLSNLVYGAENPDYRLSDARVVFLLSWKGEDTVIDEPVGWDAIEWVLSRDRDWHGINFEYTGDQTNLTFIQKEAVAIIENAYRIDGPDAVVLLKWKLAYGSEELTMQTLRLQLDRRKKSGYTVNLPAERRGLHPDLKARWSTPVGMTMGETLDGTGTAIVPPSPVQLILHGQVIKQTTTTEQDTPDEDTGWVSFDNSPKTIKAFFIYFPLANPKPNELDISGAPLYGISTSPDTPVFTSKYNGKLKVVFDVDFFLDCRLQKRAISINPPDIRDWQLSLRMGPGGNDTVGPTKTGIATGRFLNGVRYFGRIEYEINLTIGQIFYLYGVFQFTGSRDNWKGTDVRVTYYKTKFNMEFRAQEKSSACLAYRIPDVLNQVLTAATGKPDRILAPYYESGFGSRRLLMSGMMLRNFTVLDKPMKTSLQEIFASLQAVDAIGFGYQPQEDGEDKLFIQKLTSFYGNREILALADYTVIEEETDSSLIHNKIEIGYDTYADEGPQTLDEFCTKHTYATPLKAGSTYSQISPYVASGYALEMTRREQFADKPTDSTTYDEKVFMVCATPGSDSAPKSFPARLIFDRYNGKAAVYINSISGPTEPLPTWIAAGVRITITGTLHNNGDYVAGNSEDVYDQIEQHMWLVLYLDKPVTYEEATGTLYPTGQTDSSVWSADSNEDFERVTGVVDAETSYNLRIAPRYNLYRHFGYLSGGLAYKNGSEKIICQSVAQNGSLITRIAETASGDTEFDVRRNIQHNDALYVAATRAKAAPVWTPETVTIKTRLTLDQMLYLRACLQGVHPDPTLHYGYLRLIGLTDADDVTGHVLEIKLVASRKEATIKLLKRWADYNRNPDPDDTCENYATRTFADFEGGGTIPGFLENCTFGVFN